MLDLSKVWPEWKAVEKVGEGSFGKVFKCEREEYGISSVSAIKVISIPQSKAELESMSFEGVTEEGARTYFSEIVNDFANEIKLMEMLKGAPNVVAVENYKIVERADEIGWDIYIRMEYLQSFVAYSKNKKFTEAEVKKFALDISNALDICSKNGVIHRDVKPDNIFVDKFGSFKLGDFGVARRLEGSMSMMSKKGTYSYMAPEVFRGEKYDHRADIYSLGMVMYKLLNRNRDPFIDPEKPVVSFKERNESLERRRRGERLPAPIDASPEMASVILRACEFRPEDRYLTVDDFRNAILSVGARIINDEPTAKLFEDKTIVVAPRVFEFDETEPAVMTANPPAHSSDEPTVFADDEPTAFADDEATVMAGDEPTMIDEPTAFAQDVTCMADEPTVFAQDVTVFDDGKEPTVFADDEATVMAEPKHKRVGYAIASEDETVLPTAQRETDEKIIFSNNDVEEIKDTKLDKKYFVAFVLSATAFLTYLTNVLFDFYNYFVESRMMIPIWVPPPLLCKISTDTLFLLCIIMNAVPLSLLGMACVSLFRRNRKKSFRLLIGALAVPIATLLLGLISKSITLWTVLQIAILIIAIIIASKFIPNDEKVINREILKSSRIHLSGILTKKTTLYVVSIISSALPILLSIVRFHLILPRPLIVFIAIYFFNLLLQMYSINRDKRKLFISTSVIHLVWCIYIIIECVNY